MADRQSQGLQIALIAAVMLDIVFGVVAYLMWRQFDEQKIAAAASEKKASEAQTATSAAQQDAAKFKEWMGFATTDSADAIGKGKDEDMTAYAEVFRGTYPASDRVYRKVLRSLYDTVKEKEKSIADELQKRKDAELQATTLRAELATKVQAEAKNTTDVRVERDNQKDEFETKRNEILKEQQRLAAEKKDAIDKGDAKAAELQGAVAAADTQITQARDTIQDLRHDLEQGRKQTFEVALGKVISVNQAQGIVYINLGESDALGRLTTFTVYDADTTDVSRGGKKASIEVTQLLGPHMAEARLVQHEYGDPVLAGDVIYTPAWKPGQRRHFALVGLIDVDGDKKSDLDLVRSLIAANGGVVDSYRDRGQRTGKMTPQTDFLVIGTRPEEDPTPQGTADREDITSMTTQAERLLVKQILLKDLLVQMGWKTEGSLQKFGPGARSQDFKPRSAPGAQPQGTGNVSPLFKPRQQKSGVSGTY